MAPPVTPSPHRFLAGQRRAPSPTKESQPSAAPRPQYKTTVEHTYAPSQTTSSQFAPTPRFGKVKPATQRSPSPTKPAIAQTLRSSLRPTEVVEDAPSQDDDEEMLDNEQAYAVPTTEEHEAPSPWTNDLALSPKRRRLDAEEGLYSPERRVFKHPQTPASCLAKAEPRVLSRQTQDSLSTHSTSIAAPRPTFLRSSVAPSEPSEPLPDAFSPHRRGQKFVPGGMAATMQQWVLETGQSAAQSRKGQGYLRGEDYITKVKIERTKGTGPYVVEASTPSGERVRAILAGTGQFGGARAQEIANGSIVGIRAPSWSVDVDGARYTVAVDWKILPG